MTRTSTIASWQQRARRRDIPRCGVLTEIRQLLPPAPRPPRRPAPHRQLQSQPQTWPRSPYALPLHPEESVPYPHPLRAPLLPWLPPSDPLRTPRVKGCPFPSPSPGEGRTSRVGVSPPSGRFLKHSIPHIHVAKDARQTSSTDGPPLPLRHFATSRTPAVRPPCRQQLLWYSHYGTLTGTVVQLLWYCAFSAAAVSHLHCCWPSW